MSALPVSPTLLLHLGFAFAALGFLVRDVLWLRLLASIAYGLFATVAFIREDGPAWTHVGWYTAFMAINGAHGAWLTYERQLLRLSDEEHRLRDLVFRSLDPLAVKRLMRAGTWLDLPPGEIMTREGLPARHLFLIASGEARISVSGTEIARIGPGRFVGEIGFLRAGPATATTVAEPGGADRRTRLRCLAWPQRELRRRLERDDAMRTTLYAAIGADLSAKVADDNVRLTRPA